MKKARSGRGRPVLRRVVLVILGLLLGVNVYLLNAKNVAGNQMPMPFGYGVAAVLSGSMEPTFSKGDLIFVKETDKIAVGDIVVYRSGRELIVHRVVDLTGDRVTTQGDANNVPDPTFDRANVVGAVVGWIPGVGTVVTLLKTPAACVLILVAAFLLIELSFRREKDRDEKKLDAIKDEIRRLKEERESED